MSSSSNTSLISANIDPLYASVDRILQRNYIGSWGDASAEYARIRHGLVWGELRTLFAGKCTTANKERATVLVAELESLCSEIRDTSVSSSTSHAAATAALKAWMPPPPSSSTTTTTTKKVVKNTFAALAEDSDEDEA
jgi:hypothetical protein